ncbi:MAG: lactonase family protein [Treponema sp.]|jgi:hypothetical protein|nr:lactonase family protein [Treponema sp.]
MKFIWFSGVLVVSVLALSCASLGGSGGRLNGVPFGARRIYIATVSPPSLTVIELNTINRKEPKVYPVYLKDFEGTRQSSQIGISKDGNYLWLAEDISEDGGCVALLDASSFEPLKTWNVGAGEGAHISRDGKWGFFASEKKDNPNINVFDIQKQRYLGYIELGGPALGFDTNAEGTRLYVIKSLSNMLYEYDISALPDIAAKASADRYGLKLPVPLRRSFASQYANTSSLLVHPNGKYLMLGAYTPGPLGRVADTSVYDIILDLTGDSITEFLKMIGGNHNYALSPDGNVFFSTEWYPLDCHDAWFLRGLPVFEDPRITTQQLRYFDISTLESAAPNPLDVKLTGVICGNIHLGFAQPDPLSHEVYDPSGNFLFLATISKTNETKGDLLILDGKSLELIKTIPLPESPDGISTDRVKIIKF